MPRDQRDLLQVLKAELEFLEKGGYASQQVASWRAPFIFEDSPSCFGHIAGPEHSCSDCVLINLVPAKSRTECVPCRHIPITTDGATIDSLYRSGTQRELEWALDKWLRSKIKELEQERTRTAKAS